MADTAVNQLGNTLGPAGQVLAGQSLRREQNQERNEEYRPTIAERAADTGGRVAETVGQGTQTAGKGMEKVGKGMQATGKGAQVAGRLMTRGGTALNATRLGAIVGVPLTAAGGATTGAGRGAQTVGKGLERAGKGVNKAGKVVDKGGKSLSNASELKTRASQLRKAISEARANKDSEQGVVGQVASAGVRQGSNWLLRISWPALAVVVTFVPALFYINLHVFLGTVIGKEYFCKLGDEWIPKKLKLAGGDAGKLGKQGVGLVEIMLLVLLDFATIMVIFIIIAVIAMIFDWIWGYFGWFISLYDFIF